MCVRYGLDGSLAPGVVSAVEVRWRCLKSFDAQAHALRDPGAPVGFLELGLRSESAFIREAALLHPRATEAMACVGFVDEDVFVRCAAVRSVRVPRGVVVEAFGSGVARLMEAALLSRFATPMMALVGVVHDDVFVRRAAVAGPGCTVEAVRLAGFGSGALLH